MFIHTHTHLLFADFGTIGPYDPMSSEISSFTASKARTKLHRMTLQILAEFWDQVNVTWFKIPQGTIRRLYDYTLHHVSDCIAKYDGHNGYYHRALFPEFSTGGGGQMYVVAVVAN